MYLENFYSISTKFEKTPLLFSNENLSWDDQMKLIKGELADFKFPIEFNQISGKKIVDVFNFTQNGFLVIDKLIELLNKESFTGFTTFPIKLTTKSNLQLQAYKGFSITGRSGKNDFSKSQIIKKRFVPDGPIVNLYKELNPGLEKWDGSDFFIPDGSIFIIITKRVYEILVKNNITNLQFTNLADYEYAHPELRK